jgi:hypothetical protein
MQKANKTKTTSKQKKQPKNTKKIPGNKKNKSHQKNHQEHRYEASSAVYRPSGQLRDREESARRRSRLSVFGCRGVAVPDLCGKLFSEAVLRYIDGVAGPHIRNYF